MENASKALLIAGAVLIVIVLISVGMMIVNSSQDVTDQVGDLTTSQSVSTFNNQFNKYQGTQKGSAVKKLLEEVATSNATNTETSQHFVNVTITGESKIGNGQNTTYFHDNKNGLTAAASKITTSARYEVVMETTDGEGYIDSISITKKTN